MNTNKIFTILLIVTIIILVFNLIKVNTVEGFSLNVSFSPMVPGATSSTGATAAAMVPGAAAMVPGATGATAATGSPMVPGAAGAGATMVPAATSSPMVPGATSSPMVPGAADAGATGFTTPASSTSMTTPSSFTTPASSTSMTTPSSFTTPASSTSMTTPSSFTTPASSTSMTTPSSFTTPASSTSMTTPSSFTTPASSTSMTTPASSTSMTTPSSFTTPVSSTSMTTPASTTSMTTPSSFTTPASSTSMTTPASSTSMTTPASSTSMTTPSSFNAQPIPIQQRFIYTYKSPQHNINDHNANKHNDILSPRNNNGERLFDEHIHNFFDEHHHDETNTTFDDNYVFKDIKSYKDTKKDIDDYVDTILDLYTNPDTYGSLKDLFDDTNNSDLKTNMYYTKDLQDLDIEKTDITLKKKLREILYTKYLTNENPNPLNYSNIPCMYYNEVNCPEERCTKVPDATGLNIKCIPNAQKEVNTCIDLYGKNNCERHSNETTETPCVWSQWSSEDNSKYNSDKYLGKCSNDGNVPKIKESCPNESHYLIKKFGKGELSETVINSICLPKDDDATHQLLYDNPYYINNTHIKKSGDGGELDDADSIFESLCTSGNSEINDPNQNVWDSDLYQCYNLSNNECHKNSKEVCDKMNDHYSSDKNKSPESYDINKHKVCFWKQINHPDSEKGICGNLL